MIFGKTHLRTKILKLNETIRQLNIDKETLIEDIKRIQLFVEDFNTDVNTDEYIESILYKYTQEK